MILFPKVVVKHSGTVCSAHTNEPVVVIILYRWPEPAGPVTGGLCSLHKLGNFVFLKLEWRKLVNTFRCKFSAGDEY